MKANKDALLEYECLKQNYLSSAIKEMLYHTIQLPFLFIMWDHVQNI